MLAGAQLTGDEHGQLADALHITQKPLEAMNHYRIAIDMKPKNEAIWSNNLGDVLRVNNDLTGAATAYEHALELNKDYVDALYSLGLTYSSLCRYDEAREKYE